jgi:hypothetical protein
MYLILEKKKKGNSSLWKILTGISAEEKRAH